MIRKIYFLIIVFPVMLQYSISASDLKINNVSFPLPTINENQIINFVWQVENIRPVSSSPYTTNVILKDENGTIVFEESKLMPSLTGFRKENVVTNTSWLATPGGTYQLDLTLINPNDIDTTNNKFEYTFIVISSTVNCPTEAAKNPVPSNNSEDIVLQEGIFLDSLSWTNPGDQEMVHLYLSTDSTLVANSDNSVKIREGVDLSSVYLLNLIPGTKYFWKVVVSCGESNKSDGVWSFTTKNCPLHPAIIISPVNNGVVPEILGVNNSVLLEWLNPPDEQINVEVYLSEDSSLVASRDPSVKMASGINLVEYRAENLEAFKTYYWGVVEICGNNSLEFAVWKFKTTNCQWNISGYAPSETIYENETLTVQFMEFVSDYIDSAEIYISTDSNDVIAENALSKSLVKSQSFVFRDIFQAEIEGLQLDHVYYWKIVVVCKGQRMPSKIYTLRTVTLRCAPAQSPSIEFLQTPTSAKLKWLNPLLVSISRIKIYLSSDSLKVVNGSVDAEIYNSENIISEILVDQIQFNIKYFWRVAIDCGEISAEAPIWNFFGQSCGKSPYLIRTENIFEEPADSLYYEGIILRWWINDNPSFNSGYRIYLSVDSSLVKTENDAALFAIINDGTTTKYKINSLSPGNTYYWKVVSFCPTFAGSSEMKSFITTDLCAPVNNPVPANNSENIPVDIGTLVWEDPGNSDEHVILFSTDSLSLLTYGPVISEISENLHYEFVNGPNDYIDIDDFFGQPTSLSLNTKYYWKVYSVCSRGRIVTETPIWNFTTQISTGINISNEIPTEYNLFQNFPNPFNPTTMIKYSVPTREFVSLKIYDVLGNEIADLVNENKEAGNYEVSFDASNYPSGLYIYSITAGSFNQVRKMMLLK